MSCYLRHIKDIFDQAGIAITPANRKRIDQAIHQAVDVAYKNCSVTWKKIKTDIKDDDEKRQAFIEQLKAAVS